MKHLICIDTDTIRGQVGDTFTHRYGKRSYPATITGYEATLNTETGAVSIVYRAQHTELGQPLSFTVPRSTVDRQLLNQ